MTYIIFRLLCNLFDLCCINLCKAAKHWDSFLSDCILGRIAAVSGWVRLSTLISPYGFGLVSFPHLDAGPDLEARWTDAFSGLRPDSPWSLASALSNLCPELFWSVRSLLSCLSDPLSHVLPHSQRINATDPNILQSDITESVKSAAGL